MIGGPILYVLGRFPETSETFISQEVAALLRSTLPVVPVSTSRRPALPPASEDARVAQERTFYPSPSAPRLAAMLLVAALCHPIALARLTSLNLGCPIFPGCSRLRRLLRAIHVLRAAHRHHAVHVHGHWTTPSDIGMLVARALGLTYSWSAHAHDIYEELPLLTNNGSRRGATWKAGGARFILSCSEAGRQRLVEILGPRAASRVSTHYHGVDTERFRPRPQREEGPPLIVSVGRLVRYKGFDRLIQLLDQVARAGADFRCVIVGDGSQRSALQKQIGEAGLGARVTLAGALSHDEVCALLSSAELFVLMPDAAAGQHGLPNVLVEAMSCGLPTLTTRLPAVAELIEDGVNGLLLPDDPGAAASVLLGALTAPDLRRRLGESARRTVLARFDRRRQMESLTERFRDVLRGATP